VGTNDNYYVRMQGRSLGPYTLDRIRQMVRKGQVGRVHEISTDGESWAPSNSFPEIFERPAEPAATAAVATATAAQQTAQVVAAPPAEPRWYYTVNGAQQGPIARVQLLSLIQGGTLSATDYVFREGTSDWTQAGNVAELASAFATNVPAGGTGGSGGTGGTGGHGIDAFCRECGAGLNRRAIMCPKCGAPATQDLLPPVGGGFEVEFPAAAGGTARRSERDQKSKTTAALLALLIGGLGAHHFYLGNAVLGVVYIFFCWTFIPAIASFVEAIVFLTMSDSAFDAKYNS
jgi:TM2 domain-containing membrane protein YozV